MRRQKIIIHSTRPTIRMVGIVEVVEPISVEESLDKKLNELVDNGGSIQIVTRLNQNKFLIIYR